MFKLITIVFLLIATTLQSQVVPADTIAPGLQYTQKIAVADAIDFSVDNLGNVYLLNNSGLLKKLNNKGDSLNVFNDVRRYGTVFSMDVTNPLKVLLYYRDFSTVVMLDRFLNRINVVDFRKAGIFQAKAVGLSYDNNVWVYDEQTARLKKIAEDGKLMMETVDLRQVLTQPPSPEKLMDRDGFVYLYDPVNGLYVFDYYGALKNELPITGLKDINIVGNTILGRKNEGITRYTIGTLDLQEAKMPALINKAAKLSVMPQGIYVLENEEILLFSYQ